MLFTKKPSSGIERVVQKLKEWVISARLEKHYTKDEIITMYLILKVFEISSRNNQKNLLPIRKKKRKRRKGPFSIYQWGVGEDLSILAA